MDDPLPSVNRHRTRSWANVVKNKSVSLWAEQDFEENRRSRQAGMILNRALNADAVIFDFGTNLPSKAQAYRLINQIGTVYGSRLISRSRHSKALLIETRFQDDEAKNLAITEGVTYDGINYRATKAISVDADIIKVNFQHLPFVNRQALEASLKQTMGDYRRVIQVCIYVEPETNTFEGEATVFLDVTPPPEVMLADDCTHYQTLTRMIHFDNWNESFPASWKNAPPLCRYCHKEGHNKFTCPEIQKIECYYCHGFGHRQHNCSVRRRAEKEAQIEKLTDQQLLDNYHITPTQDRHTSSTTSPPSVSSVDQLPPSLSSTKDPQQHSPSQQNDFTQASTDPPSPISSSNNLLPTFSEHTPVTTPPKIIPDDQEMLEAGDKERPDFDTTTSPPKKPRKLSRKPTTRSSSSPHTPTTSTPPSAQHSGDQLVVAGPQPSEQQ